MKRVFCVYGISILCSVLALLIVLGGCTGQATGPEGLRTGSSVRTAESAYQKFQTEFTGLFDTLTIVIGYTGTQEEFDRFADIIYGRMEGLHRLYDIYHEYEGVINLHTINKNAGVAPVAADKDIIDMLLLARKGYELSGGLVDVTLGPVLRIWHEYRSEGIDQSANASLPPMDELQRAMQAVDFDELIIDQEAGTVFLRKPGMSLDVGSVAKAYAAQLAMQDAADAGMNSGLISSGGNIVSFGKPLDGVRDHWSIGIQDPDLQAGSSQNIVDTVYLTDLTVSCSGGYQRYYTVDGQPYHHIIDPETLMPAALYKQVAVIHENAGLADLLSTALFIMSYEEGAALAAKCGAEALWMDMDGNWQATEGYRAMSKAWSGSEPFGGKNG